MIVELKVNGKRLSFSKEVWENMSNDQRLRYNVIDKTDSPSDSKTQVVTNEVGKAKKK